MAKAGGVTPMPIQRSSPEKAAIAAWRERGYRDGLSGRLMRVFSAHGAITDAYLAGYRAGKKERDA